ncbi:hypothetical protein [Streptomyces sp. NBC_00306]|uniref:hypothetical protein n=1 Tax=Streptomyces sp. NBC_00306 TaxID=2975708 RepID=UPI002E2BEA94|nr:hypothetical protein [Streptomyces sp. NBC_00306]
MTETRLTVVRACGLCENPIADGYLCPGCTRATAERLDRMPRLWEALAPFVVRGSSGSAEYVTRSHAAPALPLDERVLDLQVVVLVKTLEDWRAFMHADRGMREPVLAGNLGRRVLDASRSLANSLGWMVDHWSPVGAMATEVRDLERDVASIVDPEDPRDRGTRVGHCPAVFEDGVICGAVLRHYGHEASVTCRWCGTVYPPTSWLALADDDWADEDGEQAQAS